MDLLLEALRFGVAILAGGIVAVIAQRIAFRHARSLAADDRRGRRAGTLRALLQELEENIERCGPPDRTRAPIRISKSAWEAARELELGADVFKALRSAYAAGEDLNSRIGIQDAFAATPVIVEPNPEAPRARSAHEKTLSESAVDYGDRARRLFEAARDQLKPLI
jgi:hypothetical protein